jgi:hypothetical protein
MGYMSHGLSDYLELVELVLLLCSMMGVGVSGWLLRESITNSDLSTAWIAATLFGMNSVIFAWFTLRLMGG